MALDVSEQLAELIPRRDKIIVAESGITAHQDCLRLEKSRIFTFLVAKLDASRRMSRRRRARCCRVKTGFMSAARMIARRFW